MARDGTALLWVRVTIDRFVRDAMLEMSVRDPRAQAHVSGVADEPPVVALDGGYCQVDTVLECPRCATIYPDHRVPGLAPRALVCGPCDHYLIHTYGQPVSPLRRRARRDGERLESSIYSGRA